MRYANRAESRVLKPEPIAPTRPGFYWAKWRIAEDGTRDGEDLTPSSRWEVVEVYENYDAEGADDYFRAQVTGVEQPQAVENFVWARPVRPLAEPV